VRSQRAARSGRPAPAMAAGATKVATAAASGEGEEDGQQHLQGEEGDVASEGRAHAHPVRLTLRRCVVRLQHILRLLALSRRRRRSAAMAAAGGPCHVCRGTSLQLLNHTQEAKDAFQGRMLTCAPVMRSTNRLLEYLSPSWVADFEGKHPAAPGQSERKLLSLAMQAVHQAKVSIVKAAWNDSVLPLVHELDRVRHRHDDLRRQFDAARTEYLKEVAMLRDELRVRGDPESCLAKVQRSADVTFYYEPMDSLGEEEREFALKVVSEKLKMILEANPTVVQTMDFGQVAKLQELFVTAEVRQLQAALEKRSREGVETRNEIRRLQKELAQCEKARVAAVTKNRDEFGSAEANAAIAAKLEEQLRESKEQIRDIQGKLKAKESAYRKLTRRSDGLAQERDERERLRLAAEEAREAAEEQAIKALSKMEEAAKREKALQVEVTRLSEHGEVLAETNESLRRSVNRWRVRHGADSPAPAFSEIGSSGIGSPGAPPQVRPSSAGDAGVADSSYGRSMEDCRGAALNEDALAAAAVAALGESASLGHAGWSSTRASGDSTELEVEVIASGSRDVTLAPSQFAGCDVAGTQVEQVSPVHLVGIAPPPARAPASPEGPRRPAPRLAGAVQRTGSAPSGGAPVPPPPALSAATRTDCSSGGGGGEVAVMGGPNLSGSSAAEPSPIGCLVAANADAAAAAAAAVTGVTPVRALCKGCRRVGGGGTQCPCRLRALCRRRRRRSRCRCLRGGRERSTARKPQPAGRAQAEAAFAGVER